MGNNPYIGTVIARFSDGHELRRLTSAEKRRAGHDLYCVTGLTHWNPPEFFREEAQKLEDRANVLWAAANILVGVTTNA